jgi:hypothetical protein
MNPDEGSPPNDRPDPYIGTVLAGRYRIIRLLGTGAMGAVYLGEHIKIGRQDAIKVLHPAMERDPEAIARFTRGARNASSIRHRNVCTVYDFGETEDQRAFLAMEYVEGEQLSDLLAREGRLAPKRALHIAAQAADALQAAHFGGIVHRDLKPGNIMIGKDRQGVDLVKVVDFDIAKGGVEGEEDEVTRLGFVVGTPEYMSPEQLTGDPLDGRSDLYSLGLVLFKALTGGYPFPAESTQELMVKRLTEEPLTLGEAAPGVDFPAELQALLDRCLQRKAVDRFDDAGVLAKALRDVAAGTASAASAAPAEVAPAPAVPPTQTVGAAPVPETVVTVAEPEGGRPNTQGVPKWAFAVALGAVVLVGGLVWSVGSSGGGAYALAADPGTLALSVGESAHVQARVLEDGDVVSDVEIGWSSSDARVASVSSAGLVTALEPGRAIVRLTFASVADSVVVVVAAHTAWTLDPSQLSLTAVAGQVGDIRRARLMAGDGNSRVTLTTETSDGAPAPWIRATHAEEGPGAWIEVHVDASDLTPGEYSGRVVLGSTATGEAELTVHAVVTAATRPDPVERIAIEPGDVDLVLSRQLSHLTGSGGAPATAVRDTIGSVLGLSTLTSAQQARAYYVQASALWELGEPCAALRASELAVTLEPEAGAYATLRNQLRELCR